MRVCMKKLLILFSLTILLITSTANAISIQELQANNKTYTLFFSNNIEDIYIDTSTVKTVRNQGHFYIINATAYSVNYKQGRIYRNENSYFFDQNRRSINWRPNATTIYYLNGKMNHSRVQIDDIKGSLIFPSAINSPSYIVATKLFQNQFYKTF